MRGSCDELTIKDSKFDMTSKICGFAIDFVNTYPMFGETEEDILPPVPIIFAINQRCNISAFQIYNGLSCFFLFDLI